MVMRLFEILSAGLNSIPIVALCAAFLWGIISILLSPCHLASIPLIVGFVSGQENLTIKRSFSLSFLFSLGILLTITVIGLITGLMGRMLGDIGGFGNHIVGGLLIVFGASLMDLFDLPMLGRFDQAKIKGRGEFSAFLLGLFFGIALGPCTFAFLAPVLGIVFNVSSANLIYAIALLLVYAIGHCSVIVFAGTFTEIVQKYLNWNERSNGTVILKKICGAFVILGGIYLLIGGMKQ